MFKRMGFLTAGLTQLIFILLLLVASYSVIRFRLAGPQPGCMSVRDFAEQLRSYGLRLDAAGLLHRLANQSAHAGVAAVTQTRLEEDRRPTADVDRRQKLRVLAPVGRRTAEEAADTSATRPPSYFVHDSLPHEHLLNSSFAPNVVYYVWCGRRWFEFQHYLSVMSVVRLLRPDNIVFCYDAEPVVDSWTYSTWYSEIADYYPFFHRHRLLDNEPACLGHSTPNMTFVRTNLLTATGGMYVNEQTILARYELEQRLKDLVVGYVPRTDRTTHDDKPLALMATKPGVPGHRSVRRLLSDGAVNSEQLTCSSTADYVRANRKSPCVFVDPDSSLFPRDIWELDDSFDRLARTVLYGSPAIRRPRPRYDDQLIVWLNGGKMDFLFYLCVASLIYVARVDAVYRHGNRPHTRWYWNLIKDHPKLHLIYRQHPGTVRME